MCSTCTDVTCTMLTAPASGGRSMAIAHSLRKRDVRHGRNVDAAVPLEQTLVSRRQEREPVEIVLVVDFDAFGEAGSRVARHDQADQHAVHVHLIAVRRSPPAQAPAVGEARIDRRVERDDVPVKPSAIGIGRFNSIAKLASPKGR